MNKKNLVIVESPAKAKTIEKFLGKDFVVRSSFGHIRDLPKKGINIDIANGFAPTYEIPSDKSKVVRELKKEAKAANTVWLASDEDREGEAIAWHLAEALGLDTATTKRIVFHEITESAIKNAIEHPRTIDIKLVDAQQARRILDRIVGYELSPILWKKVRPGLSAGRVQSVSVRLIVEREREISDFVPEASFRVQAVFTKGSDEIPAELNIKLESEEEATRFLEELKGSAFKVTDITLKPSSRNPSAPFTTSTLQQEAARKLGFSVKQTMTLAQRLYETGLITYMRTDSTNLSGQAIAAAKSYITKNYGKEYHQVRQFKTKNSSAQEAHEAIRPTSFETLSAGGDESQKKLYQLIWKRTLASQMSPAKTDKTEVRIGCTGQKAYFVAKGEMLKFEGFLKVYGGGKEDAILPVLVKGDELSRESIIAKETFSRPPARYSEASLVKALEELGIGRPSTYAPTISTIQTRGYIEKADLEGIERTSKEISLIGTEVTLKTIEEVYGADKNKLLPTHLAEVTTDFLVKYFGDVINSGFTATVEKDLDEVAEGNVVWQKSLAEFYEKFHPLVEKAGDVSRQETSQARLLGNDPKSGIPIYARFGRFGPMLQRGEVEDEKKPDFAPMPAGVKLENVTLEEALTMFTLPRLVGKTAEGEEIKANIGRFGPYIQIGKIFVSIKPLDPFTITEAEALDLYAAKKETLANREIKVFEKEGISILNGQYGPYITDGKKNARIPKTVVAADIDLEQAKEMLSKAKPARKKIVRRRSK
jgi:DNA topoisomerase I